MSFVLLVDSHQDDLRLHHEKIEAARLGCSVITANDLETANRQFTYALELELLAAVIVDGAVPLTYKDIEKGEERLTSLPLIKAIRQSGFEGLIVATSSRQDYLATMVQHGCSSGVPKREAAQLVINWLQGDHR